MAFLYAACFLWQSPLRLNSSKSSYLFSSTPLFVPPRTSQNLFKDFFVLVYFFFSFLFLFFIYKNLLISASNWEAACRNNYQSGNTALLRVWNILNSRVCLKFVQDEIVWTTHSNWNQPEVILKQIIWYLGFWFCGFASAWAQFLHTQTEKQGDLLFIWHMNKVICEWLFCLQEYYI